MATLREYFFTEFTALTSRFECAFRRPADEAIITVTAAVHYDFESFVQYVSCFITEDRYTPEIAAWVSQFPNHIVEAAAGVEVTSTHPAVHERSTVSRELPFSNRVFLYIDAVVPTSEAEGLIDAAAESGIHLQIKDKGYSNFMTANEKPRAFISHDSRDKPGFVGPLAAKLRSMMCPVWYDEYSLQVGDSLRESIDKGLKDAPTCIVVLSPSFLSNPGWTKAEFNAAMGKHISNGGSVLLPIWHNVGRAEVADFSPMVADLVALRSDTDLDELAQKLFARVMTSAG